MVQAITAKSGAKIDISRDAKDGVVPITVTGSADMLKSGNSAQLIVHSSTDCTTALRAQLLIIDRLNATRAACSANANRKGDRPKMLAPRLPQWVKSNVVKYNSTSSVGLVEAATADYPSPPPLSFRCRSHLPLVGVAYTTRPLSTQNFCRLSSAPWVFLAAPYARCQQG